MALSGVFFCLAITLHNLEEAIWLPAWSQQASRFQKPVSEGEFRFAVTVITGLAYLSAISYQIWPHADLIKWVFTGFLGAMILNTFFPHLLVTLIMKQYAPGLLTGLLLNVPINAALLFKMIDEQLVFPSEVLLSTGAVSSVLLMLIPLLFRMGRQIMHGR